MSDGAALPWLVAAPGMRLDAVTAASTVALDRTDFDGLTLLQPAWPHCVRVLDAQRGFDLPLGLFTVVEARDGRVTRVRATPVEEALAWPDALARADAVHAALAAARWIAAERVAPADLARALERADEALASRWRSAPWVASVSLVRAARAGTDVAAALAHDGDAWLVTVTVADGREGAVP